MVLQVVIALIALYICTIIVMPSEFGPLNLSCKAPKHLTKRLLCYNAANFLHTHRDPSSPREVSRVTLEWTVPIVSSESSVREGLLCEGREESSI